MSPPNETDVQFLARIMWEFSGSAGYPLTVDDTAHLHDLAYPDTPAPVEEREGPCSCEECDDSGLNTNQSDDTGGIQCPACNASFVPEGGEEQRLFSGDIDVVMTPDYVVFEDAANSGGVVEVPIDWFVTITDRFRSVWAEMREEPKERGDGDALEMLQRYVDDDGASLFPEEALDMLKAERARHAGEVERLKARHSDLAEGKLLPMTAQVRELEKENERLRIDRGAYLEACKTGLTRAEKAEAESAELRGKVRFLEAYGEANVALKTQLEALQFDYDNLAGGEFPGFGVDPKDSSRLSDLLACIDTHGIWPSEEAEDAGDYEAAIRHMGEVCQERSCLFSETVRFDWQSGVHFTKCLPKDPRFSGKHVEATFRALFPIGEAAEVSKPEGRDS